jgi:flagellar hook-associated protein FlgK
VSSLGLNIGLNSLLTAQAALDSIGHNLANASTPGYSRQRLEVSTGPTLRLGNLLQGTGVNADIVRRTTDALLQARLVRQVSSVARLDARLGAMGQAEAYLGGTSSSGLSALLQSFYDGLSTLAAAPEDASLQSAAVQSSAELAGTLNGLASNLEGLRRDTLGRLESEVEIVNDLAREISQLNREIASAEYENLKANDLRDRRDLLIEELAGHVPVQAIEEPSGSVRVLVDGFMLVSPASYEELELELDPLTSAPILQIGGGKPLDVTSGSIGGLVNVLQDFLPGLTSGVDDYAVNLILEINRIHSTGVAASGPYQALVAENALTDTNHSGSFGDDLLAGAGLPFDVESGELYVNVTDRTTGAVEIHRLAIDAGRTTVADLLAQLNAIPNLAAVVDVRGRLQISADTGFGFHFGRALDPDPDAVGSFGGGQATLTAAAAGPYALAAGDTLDLVGPLGAFTVAIPPGAIALPGAASAAELAAVINADSQAQANGIVAADVGGRLVLQTAGSGSSESFTLAGGSALAALGWSPSTITGHDTAVAVAIGGEYTGSQNGVLTFRPNMDGTVGTTPGLKIQVFDASGAQLAELDVGAGYTPLTELEVLDGVKLSLGFGQLSATDGDVFDLHVVADSDTADVLPALGLGVLFGGHDAATIHVRDDLLANPDMLAASASGASGDAGNLLRLLALDTQGAAGLGGATLGEGWSDVLGEVALEINSAGSARESEQFLLESFEQRRAQLTGVNVDEELVFLIEQEQAFNAASQYIRVVADLNTELMNLI